MNVRDAITEDRVRRAEGNRQRLSRRAYGELVGLTEQRVWSLEQGKRLKAGELEQLLPHLGDLLDGQDAGEPQAPEEPVQLDNSTQPVDYGADDWRAERQGLLAAYSYLNQRLAEAGITGALPFPWPSQHTIEGCPPGDLARIRDWVQAVHEWLDGVREPTDDPTRVSATPQITTTDPSGPAPAPVHPPALPTTRPRSDQSQPTIRPRPVRDEPTAHDTPDQPEPTTPPTLARDPSIHPSPPTVEPLDPNYRYVTNGELRTWARCRRQWWFGYFRKLGLKAVQVTGPASVGTRVHRVLAAYYVPVGAERRDVWEVFSETLREDEKLLEEQFASPERRERWTREVDLARAMLEGYLEWVEETAADAGLTITAPETRLTADLRIPELPEVRLLAKLDVRAVRQPDGARLFLDHKPQPLSAPVLTPTGWVKMGEIRVGDVVLGAHGEPVRVTAVYDRGVDEVYEIEMNDGTYVRATADHPWVAKTSPGGMWSVVETRDLTPKQSRLRSFEPHRDDADADLPVAPYALGAWIANGHRRDAYVSDGVRETLDPLGEVKVTAPRKIGYSPQYAVNLGVKVRDQLDELNLLGLYSRDRFIPRIYLHAASYNQRLALLHGLMDGDGSFTTTHSSIYITTSSRLAEDVAELIRSLGAWAKVWRSPSLSRVGTRVDGYDTGTQNYRVYVRSDFNPFLRIEHAQRWMEHKDRIRGHRGVPSQDKIVLSVRPVNAEEVRCIRVDSEEHLYVTSGHTVTHNTRADLVPKTLHLDEQMLHYHLTEFLHLLDEGQEGTMRTDGAIYNMLRKVKRSSTARPPFYGRVEVRHNLDELRSYWMRVKAKVLEIEDAKRRLEEGEDHRSVCYPMPTNECSFQCDYFQLCPMYDDGSRAEDFVQALYVEVNPLRRYEPDQVGVVG